MVVIKVTKESRVHKSIKNTGAVLLQTYLGTIMSFVCRTVFIKTLGTVFLGVNGLFSNILSMLSLMELGVGSAITFFLYKPIAQQDTHKINALMKLYAMMYRMIGIAVAVIGIAVIPFLKYLVKAETEIPHLTLIYLLTLSNVVISYFFTYRRSLFEADQKAYVNSINNTVFSVLMNVIQIVVLITLKNFYLYLLINTLMVLASNIAISVKAKKAYPFLSQDKQYTLTKEEKKHIFSRMGAVFCHKLGSVVVNGTDNILLSIFTGIEFVGLYSNYDMIVKIINMPLSRIFASMQASVGNVGVVEKKEKAQAVFRNAFFMNFWLYGFCTICLWILLNPFITLWIGKEYTMNGGIIALIVLNFYMSGMRQATGTFGYAKGLFWNTRFKPLFESAINLAASIIFGKLYGSVGVFIGTFLSMVTVSSWVDAYVIYKHWFKQPFRQFIWTYVKYSAVMLFAAGICTLLSKVFFVNNILLFVIICAGIGAVVPNVIFYLFFGKTAEFRYFSQMIGRMLQGIKSKIRSA